MQAAAMANTVGPSVLALGGMVPSFTGDGNGVGIQDFLNVLEQVGIMGAWKDEQLIGVARCKMVGAAYSFAWHDEDVQSANAYDRFKQLALDRFDTEPQHVKMEKFYGARQERGEDVRSFATRVRKLGNDSLGKFEGERADEKKEVAKEVVKQQLRTQFLNGLRDPVRRFALSHSPKTFEEAVEVAVREERNERLVGGTQTVRKVDVEQERTDMLERLERLEVLLARSLSLNEERERHSRYRPTGRREGRQVICYKCGKPGHIARNCQSRSGDRFRDPVPDPEPKTRRETATYVNQGNQGN